MDGRRGWFSGDNSRAVTKYKRVFLLSSTPQIYNNEDRVHSQADIAAHHTGQRAPHPVFSECGFSLVPATEAEKSVVVHAHAPNDRRATRRVQSGDVCGLA